MSDAVKEFFDKHCALMREFGIDTPESLIRALGDRYDSATREALMARLSVRDKGLLKKIYLTECNAGLDREPACIAVYIDWRQSVAWRPSGSYFVRIQAYFDRISGKVKYSCDTNGMSRPVLREKLTEEFEDAFFTKAEGARWADDNNGSFALDASETYVRCCFADGKVFESKGNLADYAPYEELCQMSDDLFQLLCEPFRPYV